MFGIDRYDSGTVLLHGAPLPAGDPRAAIRGGVALVPEDRRQEGLLMDASIARNIAITVLDRLRRRGLIHWADEKSLAERWATTLQLKHAGLEHAVDRLSGGNQQKVVLAKWLATNPKLLVIDEPTRGIDVGTKAEVHRMLGEFASQGMAVLMISQRAARGARHRRPRARHARGSLVQELSRAEATQERIMLAATGQAAVA